MRFVFLTILLLVTNAQAAARGCNWLLKLQPGSSATLVPGKSAHYQTKRLKVRVYDPKRDDYNELKQLLKEPDIANELAPVLPPQSRRKRREEFFSGPIQLVEATEQWVSTGQVLMIFEKSTHRLVGSVTLLEVDRADMDQPFIGLGYWIGTEFRGRGYATEAVEGLMKTFDRYSGRRYFVADVGAENLASQLVLEKLGFDLWPESSDDATFLYRREP